MKSEMEAALEKLPSNLPLLLLTKTRQHSNGATVSLGRQHVT